MVDSSINHDNSKWITVINGNSVFVITSDTKGKMGHFFFKHNPS